MKLKKILTFIGLLTLTSCMGQPTSSLENTSSIRGPLFGSDLTFTDSDADKILSTLKTELPCVKSAKSYKMTEMTSSNADALIFEFKDVSNVQEAIATYETDLENLDFELLQASVDGSIIDFAQKEVGTDLIQVVYYSESTSVVVESYIYYNQVSIIYDSKTWPSSQIESFTGGIIVPEYSPEVNKGYMFSIGEDAYGPYMMVALTTTPPNAIEEYNTILESANWTLDNSYYVSYGTMIALDPTSKVKLYYEIVNSNLEISITLEESSTPVDGRPNGGGDSSTMTPTYEKPESYSHDNLHGFILDDINEDETQNVKGHAGSFTTDGEYNLVDTKKFAFDVQCGEFFGGKYYFFTTDYQFGWATYSEEEGYGQTYLQPSINPIVNSLFNQGYYLVPMDMSFNYDDMKMYVLWAQWGLYDSDEDGYYDSLNPDGFESQYISTMNLITFEAGAFKNIVAKTSGKSVVLTGIAYDLEGQLYGLAHTSEVLAKVYFDEDLDAYYLEHYDTKLGKHPSSTMWMFFEYFHASLAFDHNTGKLYYSWSDWGHWEIVDGFSEWSGSLGGIMELNTETGAANIHLFETAYEITGLFSVYYK